MENSFDGLYAVKPKFLCFIILIVIKRDNHQRYNDFSYYNSYISRIIRALVGLSPPARCPTTTRRSAAATKPTAAETARVATAAEATAKSTSIAHIQKP